MASARVPDPSYSADAIAVPTHERPAIAPAPPASADGGTPVHVEANDGYLLGARLWRLAPTDHLAPVVVINAATSVQCRYYDRFAAWLHARGMNVLTYDYRGIGLSRQGSLRGFRASWTDWGRQDFGAMLDWTARHFPGHPIDVVAHSFGGCAIGMAPLAGRVRRAVTVGSQYAYWRDYDARRRRAMLMKWHVAMPLLTAACGYFPGKRLGWLEDTPAGVVRDWIAPRDRYQDLPSARESAGRGETLPFDTVRARLLAISVDDDPFGTVDATERLLALYPASHRTHLHVSPQDIGVADIGHFAFFHSRFSHTLWPIALQWLLDGALAEGTPGQVLPRHPTSDT